MTSPISNTGPSASDRSKRGETVFNLQTARSMLPLVRHIIHDILHTRQELARQQPEQRQLDRQRHTLDWPARSRRYQLRDEISAKERHLQEAQAELENLGVVLLDPAKGQVGFPTLVNGRRAFFSWRPSDEALRHWHFVGEKVRRLIPAAWNLEPQGSVPGQS